MHLGKSRDFKKSMIWRWSGENYGEKYSCRKASITNITVNITKILLSRLFPSYH